MNKKIQFILPSQGLFIPNDPADDPLPQYYRPIVGLLYRERIQQGLNMLNTSYDSVLEFGYGSGLLLPTLHTTSKKLFAIDTVSDPKKVQLSLDKLGLSADLKIGDITQARYAKESFDLIVAFSVFEHISDPRPILEEMHYILKNGGELLVGMPRVDVLMEKIFDLIGFKGIDKHHVMTFKNFLKVASEFFIIKKKSSILPFFGLYFNVLLRKK